jgi:hypothetical protein
LTGFAGIGSRCKFLTIESIASSGSPFGQYTRAHHVRVWPSAQSFQEFGSATSRVVVLTSVSDGAVLMATSGKTLVVGLTGSFFGHEGKVKKYALAIATVSGSPPQRMQAYFLGV